MKIRPEFYKLCKKNGLDKELLCNEQGRPCVLLVTLMYKGMHCDFVVPLRSNISPKAPKDQYFPLPPTPHTKPYRKHGVHYYKLFPVTRKYIDMFLTEGNSYYETIVNILNQNEAAIINACQNYLHECEKGNKHYITPDIDGIIAVLKSCLKSN